MNTYLKVIRFSYGLMDLGRSSHMEEDALRAKGEKFKNLIQELGPTYIKLGQILSIRYDLFPKQICAILQQLLDSDKPMKYSLVEKILRDELGTKFSQLEHVDPEPIAVASIGQVHTAHLHQNHHKVAIKVQKPGIRQTLERDLKAFYSLISLISILPSIRRMRLDKVLHEFEAWTFKELDYTNEAANSVEFARIFADDNDIYVPKVFFELTTTKVLVTEFIEGVSLKEAMERISEFPSDHITLKGITIKKDKIIDIFKKSIYKQAFKVGYVHGDPHPSNLIIKDSHTIAYLDFGIVAELNHTQLEVFKNLIYNVIENNREDAVKGLIAMDTVSGSAGEKKILEQLAPYFDRLLNSAPQDYSPTKFIIDSVFELSKVGIEPPTFIVLLAKILATYDGMLQEVEPRARLFEVVAPLFEQDKMTTDLQSLTDPQAVLKEWGPPLKSLYELIKSLPQDSNQLIKELATGPSTAPTAPQLPFDRRMEQIKVIGLLVLTLGLLLSLVLVSVLRPEAELLSVRLNLILGVSSLIVLVISILYFLFS